jgi:hypothetical protein
VNDPKKPANVTCGPNFENASTVAATFSCESQNADGSYKYSAPQPTGAICQPLFCASQPVFDLNTFQKNCAAQGGNYALAGEYSCNEDTNTVTLPTCEKKCTDDKIYSGGSCTCSQGQKLSSKGVCYTPAANLCADTASLQTTTATITFAKPNITNGCEWSKNGNLAKPGSGTAVDNKQSARSEEYSTVSVPQGATVCSMEFSFASNASMTYDDHILMTYNNIVFAATEKNLLTSYLTNVGTTTAPLYQYDWSKLVGNGTNKAYADTTNVMCLDSRPTKVCSWPATNGKSGTIQMTIDPNEIQRISDLSVDKLDKVFGLITTGDNDSTDCSHAPISFSVNIHYATEP